MVQIHSPRPFFSIPSTRFLFFSLPALFTIMKTRILECPNYWKANAAGLTGKSGRESGTRPARSIRE